MDFFTLRGRRVRADGFQADWAMVPLGTISSIEEIEKETSAFLQAKGQPRKVPLFFFGGGSRTSTGIERRVGTFYDTSVLCSFEDTLTLTFNNGPHWLEIEAHANNVHPAYYARSLFAESENMIVQFCEKNIREYPAGYEGSSINTADEGHLDSDRSNNEQSHNDKKREKCIAQERERIENFVVFHCLPWSVREIDTCCEDNETLGLYPGYDGRLVPGTCLVCPPYCSARAASLQFLCPECEYEEEQKRFTVPTDEPRQHDTWPLLVDGNTGDVLAPPTRILFPPLHANIESESRGKGVVEDRESTPRDFGMCKWPAIPPNSNYREARGVLIKD